MKFYMTPGSCSTGIHILLEEAGLVFEAHVLNLPKGDHLKPDYLAINPNGTIPTLLRDDGVALTDFVSIATWIAETFPRRKLLPEEPASRETALATMAFCVGHIHGEGFRRIFVPERYGLKGADSRARTMPPEAFRSPTPPCSTMSSGPTRSEWSSRLRASPIISS
jgi:glutathione S-transferase